MVIIDYMHIFCWSKRNEPFLTNQKGKWLFNNWGHVHDSRSGFLSWVQVDIEQIKTWPPDSRARDCWPVPPYSTAVGYTSYKLYMARTLQAQKHNSLTPKCLFVYCWTCPTHTIQSYGTYVTQCFLILRIILPCQTFSVSASPMWRYLPFSLVF